MKVASVLKAVVGITTLFPLYHVATSCMSDSLPPSYSLNHYIKKNLAQAIQIHLPPLPRHHPPASSERTSFPATGPPGIFQQRMHRAAMDYTLITNIVLSNLVHYHCYGYRSLHLDYIISSPINCPPTRCCAISLRTSARTGRCPATPRIGVQWWYLA